MEYPYIALLWTPGRSEHADLAARLVAEIRTTRHWHQALQRDGLIAFTRAPRTPFLRALSLPQQRGLVLGTLFGKGDNSPLTSCEILENTHLAPSRQASWASDLTRSCWGAYVAIISGQETRDWLILRDCSGMIPCYYTTVSGVTVAFSDIQDIESLCDIRIQNRALIPLEINWKYIAGFLASSQMQIRETGLKNVYELLAGEALESLGGRLTVRLLWNPALIAEHTPTIGTEVASRELRDTAQSCIDAWAGIQNRILHRLSGGFDSSVVLALLTRAPRRPDVACLNSFSLGPGEDERHYARMAAQAAGTPLIETAWDTPALDERCLKLPRMPKPTIPHLLNGLDAPRYNAMFDTHPVDAIWTGQGGDHLFWAVKTAMSVADYRRDHGIDRGLLAVLWDATRLTGRSIPHIVVDVLTDMFSQDSLPSHFLDRINLPPQSLLLSPDVDSAALKEYICHPWLGASTALPPGKRFQILLLAEVLNRHRPLYGLQKPQEFHPLLSQPLIELCLRIPVYRLLAGGKTRGLARLAFRDLLPTPIIDREQKGHTTGFTLELLRRSAPFLTPVILEGHLAHHDLLDLRALAPALRADSSIPVPTIFPLLACVSAEIWARGWLSRYPSKRTHEPGISHDHSTTHSEVPSNPPYATPLEIRPEALTDSTSPRSNFARGKSQPPPAH